MNNDDGTQVRAETCGKFSYDGLLPRLWSLWIFKREFCDGHHYCEFPVWETLMVTDIEFNSFRNMLVVKFVQHSFNVIKDEDAYPECIFSLSADEFMRVMHSLGGFSLVKG